MGVLDTLSDFNQSVEDATDTVLDNENASLQDAVKSGIQTAGGWEGGGQEFAEDSARFWSGIDHAIATPGRVVGENTESTAATDAVARGGETVYDWFVKYPAAVGYGAATGANLKNTTEVKHASSDYSPDALDTLEVAAVAGGPVAKGALRGGSKATRAARVASKSDEAAEAAGAGASMGIISRISKTVSKTTDDAARAADDAVGTQTKLAVKNVESKSPELLQKPAHLVEGGYDSVKQAARAAYPSTKTGKAMYGGTFAVGATGLLSGLSEFPQHYEVVDRFTAQPGGTLVEEKDNSDNVLGYWVVVSTDGDSHRVLTSSAGSSGVGAMSVSFPTNREPPFSSTQQARSVFDTWASSVTERRNPTTPSYKDDPPSSQQKTWTNSSVLTSLKNGWYLVEQKHREKERYRYAIMGRGADGRMVFMGPGGTATRPPSTYPDKASALDSYEQWESGSGLSPDPSEQRPAGDDISSALGGSNAGSFSAVKTIGAGAGILAVAYLLYRYVL